VTTTTLMAALLAADIPPPAASESYYRWAGIALVVTSVGGVVASVLAFLGRRDAKEARDKAAVTAEQTTQINRAVNNVPAGELSLIEMVRITNKRVDDTNAQVAAVGAQVTELTGAVREVLDRLPRQAPVLQDVEGR
jgi:hypothetical protein